jgi:hypothetical protein
MGDLGNLFRSYRIISKELRHSRCLILSLWKCLYFFINHMRTIVIGILLLVMVLPHLIQIIYLTQLLQRSKHFIWNILNHILQHIVKCTFNVIVYIFKTANLNSLNGRNLDGTIKVTKYYIHNFFEKYATCFPLLI